MQYNIMFKRHTVIRKVYEMQGGGDTPFTHIYIYICVWSPPKIYIERS